MRWAFILFALCAAAAAHADVLSPREASCQDKKAGDACRAEFGAGTCAPSKCGRNDYSEGVPPKVKWVDCLQCVAPGGADGGVARPRKVRSR